MPGTSGTAAAPQRARGQAHLSARLRDGASVLGDLRMSGSTKLLFPRSQGRALEAVYLNSAGGVTGGDQFELSAQVLPGAAMRMTTQAAERIYRAAPGRPGFVRTDLAAEAGANLIWLPQETILFDGAALDRNLSIDLAKDARLLACETLVFGRQAMGETVQELHLRDRIDLRVEGRLIFADRLRLDGDAAALLQRAAVADGAIAMASVLCAAPGMGARLETTRAMLPPQAGASALSDDLIFLRVLAADSYALRLILVPLLQALAQSDLPRPWML